MLRSSSSHWLLTKKKKSSIKTYLRKINCNEHQNNMMLLKVTLFLQNNPSGLLAKVVWVIPPHNPRACNSKQKQTKVFSSDCNSYSMYLRSESPPAKEWDFKTELPTCVMQFFWKRVMSAIFQGSGILTINVLFHNAYHEKSFSLHSVVARHRFLLHRTFLGGSFSSQMMHFVAQVSLQSKNLPAMML